MLTGLLIGGGALLVLGIAAFAVSTFRFPD
jgi:hypothetical protein